MPDSLSIFLVTPSLQQGTYIEHSARSVLEQSRKGFDLTYVIRDAQSYDETPAKLAQLQREYPDLIVKIQRDGGQACALREEFSKSRADVLGWLNADDILLPGALESIVQVFQREKPDLVYGGAWFIDKNGKITGSYPTGRHSARHLRTTCYLSQPSVFFTREIYEKVGGIRGDLHYAMDYDFWLRCADSGGRFLRLAKPLSATRLHPETKTASGGLAFVDEIINVQKDNFGQVEESWQLYRKYRVIRMRYPSRAAGLCYALALVEYLPGSPLRFILLCCWSLKIAFRIFLAKQRTIRLLGKAAGVSTRYVD